MDLTESLEKIAALDKELEEVRFSLKLHRSGLVSMTHWGFSGVFFMLVILVTQMSPIYLMHPIISGTGLAVCTLFYFMAFLRRG